MKVWLALLLSLSALHAAERVPGELSSSAKKVYIIPIRDDIMPPLVYLVRRGVKEAMEAKADLLVLDMDTNGGRVDVTEEIIEILGQFMGPTVTYVNRKAFSAGAFISVATQKIYMAPQSVIGAAAPIILSPGGGGVEKTPETFEAKMTSGVSALVRTRAEKNGYNIAVVEKMIDKSKELKIDGEVLNEKGQILTLTNLEAEKEHGQPPRRLLSSGTVESLDELLNKLGYAEADQHRISPTGAEKIGTWINAISPILLIIGAIGIYIEFKTPGFGLPGIIGIAAFAVYFLGGYVAGFSGMEWLLVFILGLALVAIDLFVFPGTIALGLLGVALMLASILMALVDMYPGMPAVPTLPQLRLPLEQLGLAFLGSAVGVVILSRILPRTPMYRALVSQTVSGMGTELAVAEHRASLQGQVGVAISTLRPGGKAQFGETVLDVISQGDMVPKGCKVKIIGYSGRVAVVAVMD